MKNIAFLVSLIVALTVSGAALAANAVTLRSDIAVAGEQISLGDLFTGAGDKADLVIAPAPAPGQTSVFKAVSVARFLAAHGLDWRPATPVRRITVRRLAVTIPAQTIHDELRAALESELGMPHFEMNMAAQNLHIQIPADQPQTVSVESLFVNRTSGQFVAELMAPAHAEKGHRIRLTGQVYEQTEVPVLRRFKSAGEEILASDIDYITERTSTLGRQVVTDAAQLIGKSPRRAIRSGQPISLSNLGDPVMVMKGKLVSVILEQGGMYLSVSGRTLEAGGEGDVIRVENIASRKVILAEVIGPQEVRILSRQPQLAAADALRN